MTDEQIDLIQWHVSKLDAGQATGVSAGDILALLATLTTARAQIEALTARAEGAEARERAVAERVFRHGFSDGWTANQRGRLAAPTAADEAWQFYVADGALRKSIEAAETIERGAHTAAQTEVG